MYPLGTSSAQAWTSTGITDSSIFTLQVEATIKDIQAPTEPYISDACGQHSTSNTGFQVLAWTPSTRFKLALWHCASHPQRRDLYAGGSGLDAQDDDVARRGAT